MKLVLAKSPTRYLEVTLPDSVEIKFTIKPVTLMESNENAQLTQTLKDDVEAGKLSVIEYVSAMMGMLISNWSEVKDKVLNSGFEIEHIEQIGNTIRALREKKEPEEKKSL